MLALLLWLSQQSLSPLFLPFIAETLLFLSASMEDHGVRLHQEDVYRVRLLLARSVGCPDRFHVTYLWIVDRMIMRPQHVDNKVPVAMFGGSGNYASALYIAAAKAKTLDNVEAELFDLVAATEKSPTFSQFMKDLAVPADTRVKAVTEICDQAKFSEVTKNFLEVMTLKKVADLDAEFIVYKAEAKERMDALEKKFDEGIGKLDGGIGLLKSEVDQKFEELKHLILGRAPTQASTFEFPDPTKQTSTLASTFEVPDPTKLATKPNPYVPPARQGYDDIGLELHNSNGESSTTIGKNLRPEYWDVEGSSKFDQRKTNDLNGEQFKPRTDCGAPFVTGMQPTDFRWDFGVDPQAALDRETQHMMGTNQTGEVKHRGAGTNQLEHRMRKLKMPLFEGEDAYGWIYRVERYFEIQGLPPQEQLRAAALCMEGEALAWYRWSEGRTPFHSWDSFKRRLLIRFQQSQEGNLYEQFLAITQEGSARAYVALFEKLACQLVGVLETVMEATFTKGLKPALRVAVRVMNPASLNHAMELAVTIEDNRLYEGVMQSKGAAAIVGQTKTVMEATFTKGLKPALRAAVRVMNPASLNHAMELAVTIEDNRLYEGVMQSKGAAAIVGQTSTKGDNFRRMTESEIQDRKAKGLCFRCDEKYTPGHRCASRTLQVMLVDASDEADEPDLNFKSWAHGSKID
ncbi:hypothetical protein CTI12_AA104190 [Artemisia annua]|uniref:Retrotransposon gag domain-containing protein n=1 Tax=Artemisia annua TaxID=35608 RepID=A0A2U1NGL3_ARTAN|nr:hypothetical protein CTI12_AA104190 [Artemisia annua]